MSEETNYNDKKLQHYTNQNKAKGMTSRQAVNSAVNKVNKEIKQRNNN